MVSRTNVLFAAKDPNLPGFARVRIALFRAVSLRVPDRDLLVA